MLQRTLRDHTPVPGREKHPCTAFAVLTLLLRLSQNCCLPAPLCPREISMSLQERGFRFISYSLCHFFDAVSFFRLFFALTFMVSAGSWRVGRKAAGSRNRP